MGRHHLRSATVAVLGAVLVVAAACTPTPTPPTGPVDPAPPEIHDVRLVTPRTEAPVTATLRWRISDPNGDALTCRIDLDGDGTHDRTISPCPTAGDLLVTYRTAGTVVASLDVSDGTFDAPTWTTDPLFVTAGPSEPFDITLHFDPATAPEYRDAFAAASARWQQVVVDGWNPEPLVVPAGFMGWIPAFDGAVDDVLIAARVVELDGPGGLLGQAGALAKRASSGEPYFGLMEFDAADLADYAAAGELVDLIVHEMGHVLGIGFNWVGEGRVDDLLTNPTYNGPAANAAWHELGGTGQVPVEDQGDVGTRAAHWRESTFANELMTGYADSDERLSRVTIGALADRGYGVELSAADDYTLPAPWAGAARRAGRAPQHTTPVALLPEGMLKG